MTDPNSPASYVPTGYVPRPAEWPSPPPPVLTSGFVAEAPPSKAPPKRLIHDDAINRALDDYEAMQRDAAAWRALQAGGAQT